MADLDRILQLKIALDTGDLVQGMEGATSKMGGLVGQAAQFGKAFGIGLAADGIAIATEKAAEGVQRNKDLEVSYGELERRLEEIGQVDAFEGIQSGIAAMARDTGYAEDEIATALNTIMLRTDDLGFAMVSLQGAMDMTRASDELTDLAAGAELMRDVLGGDAARAADDFGILLGGMADPAIDAARKMEILTEGLEPFAGASATYAESLTGMGDRLDENVTQAFAELTTVLNELMIEVLPVLLDEVFPMIAEVWNDPVQPALQAFQEILMDIQTFIQDTEHIWLPILQGVGEGIGTAFEIIVTSAQAVIDTINKIRDAIQDVADFIDGFQFPEFNLPSVPEFSLPWDRSGGAGAAAYGGITMYVSGDPAVIEGAAVAALRRHTGRNVTTNRAGLI